MKGSVKGSSEVSGNISDASQSEQSQKEENIQSPEEEDLALDLTDDEKAVLNLLKDNSPVDLNELKGQTGLSNKKWDAAIKGLRNQNLVNVEKTDESLFVLLV